MDMATQHTPVTHQCHEMKCEARSRAMVQTHPRAPSPRSMYQSEETQELKYTEPEACLNYFSGFMILVEFFTF